MEPNGEKAEKEESSRSGARSAGRPGSERSQETGQQRKWSEGRVGQEPQKNSSRETQRTSAKAWSPQRLNLLIEAISARFGECAIGRGDHGVHFLGSR
jgi:hypothetical protein